MSYTNIRVPEISDSLRECREKLESKDLEIIQLWKRIREYDSILNNIPESIEQYGYVDFTYDLGRKTIKLVKSYEVEG